jgi:hypothetical protein
LNQNQFEQQSDLNAKKLDEQPEHDLNAKKLDEQPEHDLNAKKLDEQPEQPEEEQQQQEMGPVRFLTLRLLEPGEALAMWAAPNGTEPKEYFAEISYDQNNWRKLTLEEPTSTFATFMVTPKSEFQFRVKADDGPFEMEHFSPIAMASGKKKPLVNGKANP